MKLTPVHYIIGGAVIIGGAAILALNPDILAPKPSESEIREVVERSLSTRFPLEVREMDYLVIPGDERGSGRVNVEIRVAYLHSIVREDRGRWERRVESLRTEEAWEATHESLDGGVPVEARHVEEALDRQTGDHLPSRGRYRKDDRMNYLVVAREPGSFTFPIEFDIFYRQSASGTDLPSRIHKDTIMVAMKRTINSIDGYGLGPHSHLDNHLTPYAILDGRGGAETLDVIEEDAKALAAGEVVHERQYTEQAERFAELTSRPLFYIRETPDKTTMRLQFTDCGDVDETRNRRDEDEGMVFHSIVRDCTAISPDNDDARFRWRSGLNVRSGDVRPAQLWFIYPTETNRHSEIQEPAAMICLEKVESDLGRSGIYDNRYDAGEVVCRSWRYAMPWRDARDGFSSDDNPNARGHYRHIMPRDVVNAAFQ